MPNSILKLVQDGLLWTGAQHEDMKSPPSENVSRRLQVKAGPVQWRQRSPGWGQGYDPVSAP